MPSKYLGQGGQTRLVKYTKDKMGFDHEILDACDRHKNHKTDTIRKILKRDEWVRGELSGEAARNSRQSVTLPKFSWD